MLEKKGIPTATICSNVFITLAKTISTAKNLPSLPLVIIPHPVAGIAPEKVRARAEAAVEDVINVLTNKALELEKNGKGRP